MTDYDDKNLKATLTNHNALNVYIFGSGLWILHQSTCVYLCEPGMDWSKLVFVLSNSFQGFIFPFLTLCFRVYLFVDSGPT